MIAARVIEEAIAAGMDFELVGFNGGEKDNAIPRLANITFVSDTPFEKIEEFFRATETDLKKELEFSDGAVKVVLGCVDKAECYIKDGRNIVDYAYLMPNGFQHRSMVIEGLTVTSLNLGVATTSEKEIMLDTLIRSAMDSAAEDLRSRMEVLAGYLGLRYELGCRYSGWNYEPVSAMRELLRKVVSEFGGELKEHAGHGGNECGVFKALNPKLDIITFGPIGSGVHTPEEKLNLESFEKSYQMLKKMISECKERGINNMAKGLVVILSGASSVGKGAIRHKLLEDKDMNLFFSISETTRPMKEGEVDGVDYYFVSHKAFADSVKNRELLEYTEFNGYYYGTPKAQVEFLPNKGKNVLIEVEAQGVGPIKLNIPDALAFFVMPTSFEELERQINEIYKDDEASISRRLNKARMDMEIAPLFRNIVYNDDTDKAFEQIKKVVMAELEKRRDE